MLQSASFFKKCFSLKCQGACQASCWNCHHKLGRHKSQFFCESCHKIQPPTCNNYFELFDQPKNYTIDLSKLDKTYQTLQRKVHPDRFYSKSEKEKELSMKASGCINEGYRTLRNPISRGEYLLHLYNEKVLLDVPQDFLMNVLELHEEIDAAEEVEDMVKLLQKVKGIMKELTAELAKDLAVKDGKVVNATAAGETLSKLKYMSRIRDTLKQKMPVRATNK